MTVRSQRSGGVIDEVSVWQGGENIGAVYRPAGGGLAVWVYTGQQRRVSDAAAGPEAD